MEIKIDRATLPKNGQKVKFKLFREIWLKGEFIEGNDLFYVSENEYYSMWIVMNWEPLNNNEHEKDSEIKGAEETRSAGNKANKESACQGV